MEKNIVVTGATSGIGLASAIELAKLNHQIIITGLSKKEVSETSQKIIKETNNSKIMGLVLDLSDDESIAMFVDKLASKFKSINVLINNAGCFNETKMVSKSGLELTIAVNYFGTVRLTESLINKDLLFASSRIINLVSKAAFYAKLDLPRLLSESKYQSFKAYSTSKLALMLYGIKLSERLKDSKIDVFNVHPGKVRTNIFNGDGFMMKLMGKLMASSMISALEGARTSVYLSTTKDNISSGKLYHGESIIEYKKSSLDKALINDLWSFTEDHIYSNLKES